LGLRLLKEGLKSWGRGGPNRIKNTDTKYREGAKEGRGRGRSNSTYSERHPSVGVLEGNGRTSIHPCGLRRLGH